MKIVVLASPKSWYVRDLQRAAGPRHRVVVAEHRMLRVCLAGSQATSHAGAIALDDADAVLVRTMDAGSLEQVVFRMDVLGRLADAGMLVVNSPRAIEAAVDKFLATAKCRQAGLTVPDTIVCQDLDDALAAFDALGGNVVIKPLFGGEGRGIFRTTDRDAAYRAFKMLGQLGAIFYLQRFIQNEGFDLRLLVIGEQVLAMRRSNPTDWRSNVSRGAETEPAELTDTARHLALTACRAIGAEVAGVDVLFDLDGTPYVLEVNAVPGWRALARTLDLDVASLVLDHLVARRREFVSSAEEAGI